MNTSEKTTGNDIRIVAATPADAALLADLARQTFVESHGHSARPEDIEAYTSAKYNEAVLRAELEDSANLYHLLYFEGKAAGFSRIQLNEPYEGSELPNLAKLDRIYVLEQYYDKGLGRLLFHFLIDRMKHEGQSGAWLYVWTENKRALRFYERAGFRPIGNFDFRISANHTNPNYRMLLLF